MMAAGTRCLLGNTLAIIIVLLLLVQQRTILAERYGDPARTIHGHEKPLRSARSIVINRNQDDFEGGGDIGEALQRAKRDLASSSTTQKPHHHVNNPNVTVKNFDHWLTADRLISIDLLALDLVLDRFEEFLL
ncbi:hypothetical protein QAD02_022819 [Eretmocerus hayati]|uniref:Uncharacterized protein n=1 Tax=Eretmocerus hayati TaxID=131215 RepID=A0ACC2PTV6_9HYME|nr:hypothetical protein QAD02_022819 [Eretmocerus hayati]